jgi:hypothetical protein
MSFLTWQIGALAAATTVPLLLLLYFLKLRRRTVRVSSTFLWQQSVKDIEVNAPFRLLRMSWLLFIQLVVMALLYFALARPVMNLPGGGAARTVILIDASASMSARDGDDEGSSRLEVAKQSARRIVRDALSGAGGEAMIVSYAAGSRALTRFETSRTALLAAIDQIEPTDQPGDFAGAMQLIQAYMQVGEDEQVESRPELVLLSDGDLSREGMAAPIRLPAGSVRFVQIGPERSTGNVGIASMNARRDYDDPSLVRIFARLVSSEPEADVIAVWSRNGQRLASEAVTLTALTPGGFGEASLTYELTDSEGGLLALELTPVSEDVLDADNRFLLQLEPPTKPRILLVHPASGPDSALVDVVYALEPDEFDLLDADQFERDRDAKAPGAYDLIIFDRVTPREMPLVSTLSFGSTLPVEGLVLTPARDDNGGPFLSWRRTHPLLRYLSLDQIVVGRTGVWRLPEGGIELARGAGGTWIGLLDRGRRRHLLVAFALHDSSWYAHHSFPIMIGSALEYLVGQGAEGRGGYVRTSEPVGSVLAEGRETIFVEGPRRLVIDVSESDDVANLPALPLVGLYSVEDEDGAVRQRIAVNLADERESQLRTSDVVTVGGEEIQARDADAAAPREIWRWFVIAAIIVLAIEWLVYVRRMRV